MPGRTFSERSPGSQFERHLGALRRGLTGALHRCDSR
jgi:hypothetical protein